MIISPLIVPVIFLDIDGVLVKARNHTDIGRKPEDLLDKECVARLNTLIREVGGAELVISSTWRTIYGVVGMRTILDAVGVEAQVVGVTPDHAQGKYLHYVPRRHEIEAFLREKYGKGPFPPFLILDDETNAGLAGHFVQTSWVDGFDEKCLEEAIALLKEQVK